MSFTFTTKINKKQFEEYLYKLNNSKTLEHAVHNEHNYEDDVNTKLHLYYNDYGHIGTWQKGGHCCVFEKRIDSDDFQPQGSTVYSKNGNLMYKENK
jgi:hypothetical protein|tara:strand:- start:180 stop:470 length:291 start_codon:yes stop_codon:yes gene_type:complete